MKLNGAQLAIHALEQLGIKFTYGIPGTHTTELYDELNKSKLITPVLVTHEGGGAFMADATGTTAGALLGTSTVTTYIESATGIEEGGRTGLTAVVVSVLFLLSMFFTPLFISVPALATAPALIVVGAMMMTGARELDWGKMDDAIPAFLTVVTMPFTYSIAHGITLGVVSYVLMRLATGQWREIHPIMAVLATLLIAFHVFS